MHHRFSTPTPPRLTIEFRAGTIVIDTAEVTETTVDLHDRRGDDDSDAVRDTIIEQRGDEIVVLVPKDDGFFSRTVDLDLRITAPTRAALHISSGSADITANGEYGTTAITSGSGDVTVGSIADSARLRAGSGNLRLDAVAGDLEVGTGSGDVTVGSVGGRVNARSGSGDLRVGAGGRALRVKTGSGDVAVDIAPDELQATTGSGDVHIGAVERGDVKVRVASGDIYAGVRTGTAAWLDVRTVSGRVSNDLEHTDAPSDEDRRVRLQLESVSGSIRVARS